MHSVKEILDKPGKTRDPKATTDLKELRGRIAAGIPADSNESQILPSSEPQQPASAPVQSVRERYAEEFPVKCKLCSDEGWIRVGNRLKPCKCRSEAVIQGLLPPRYHTATLGDFPALGAQVLGWIAKPGDGLLLMGAVGAGKTHMAAAIVRHLVESGHGARFTRAADFYSMIRDTYTKREDPPSGRWLTERELIHRETTVDYLVLDDLGSGNLSDHERRCTLELIDQRVNDLLPTIVTSNWSLKDISEKLDERVASRLGTFKVIAFKGEDKRTPKKQK